MMPGTLGIDTSNYTTSAAIYTPELPLPISVGRLLAVAAGGRGLRQSDAVFAHVKNLPDIVPAAVNQFDGAISAIGVSVRPRDAEGSYMPCFLAGLAAAASAASVLHVPLYEFSHQANHVAAAAYGAGVPALLDRRTDHLLRTNWRDIRFGGRTGNRPCRCAARPAFPVRKRIGCSFAANGIRDPTRPIIGQRA